MHYFLEPRKCRPPSSQPWASAREVVRGLLKNSGGPEESLDFGPHRLGQVGPGVDNRRQIGVGGAKCAGFCAALGLASRF